MLFVFAKSSSLTNNAMDWELSWIKFHICLVLRVQWAVFFSQSRPENIGGLRALRWTNSYRFFCENIFPWSTIPGSQLPTCSKYESFSFWDVEDDGQSIRNSWMLCAAGFLKMHISVAALLLFAVHELYTVLLWRYVNTIICTFPKILQTTLKVHSNSKPYKSMSS